VRLYDVDGLFGVRIRRATYLIRADGIIEDAVLADFRVSRHLEFIRKAIGTAADVTAG
jgi:peroxiredoxin